MGTVASPEANKETEMDVRNSQGEQVQLVPGMWYVGMNWLNGRAEYGYHINTQDTGAGAIAQYVGNDEFYDDRADEPTAMNEYEYIVQSHMGKL